MSLEQTIAAFARSGRNPRSHRFGDLRSLALLTSSVGEVSETLAASPDVDPDDVVRALTTVQAVTILWLERLIERGDP